MIIHNSNSFRTEYHPRPVSRQIDHQAKLLTIGSCFSDNIGQRLSDNKFSVLVNPAGTVYNPISIFKLLRGDGIDDTGFVELNEQFYHHDFHSSHNARDKNTLKTVLEFKLKEITEYLAQADYLFVTLGTAYVYEEVNSGKVVANCHKVPQKNFNKRLLELSEMSQAFNELVSIVKDINPSLAYIFTVSPVRHLKDGISENQLSKSLLRVFCHEMSQRESVEYFPAYELMMDDLRDYRFYKTDMIHPTEMAEDYIWDKFRQSYFSEQTEKLLKEWTKIRTAIAHRAFNPGTESHQKFLKDQLEKLKIFAEYFDVTDEHERFEGQLQ